MTENNSNGKTEMGIEDLIKLRDYISRVEMENLKVSFEEYKILRKYWDLPRLKKKDFNGEDKYVFRKEIIITLNPFRESHESTY